MVTSDPATDESAAARTDDTHATADTAHATALAPAADDRAFHVRLPVFEGPFDLLLSLIAKHKLDVTEVALSQVTDDFLAHIRAMGKEWDLGQATEFLVVASTLLDLKAARLLPGVENEDEEDLALLEARDLLFARLLQYRAYKVAAEHLAALLNLHGRGHPRNAPLEPRFQAVLPELRLDLTPQQLAELAAHAMRPRRAPVVDVAHVHANPVSVAEQTAILRERLMTSGTTSFRTLTSDCTSTLEVVARFLALLDLYRSAAVAFEQVTPLGELQVRWVGESHSDGDAGAAADTDADAGTDSATGGFQ